jgi:glutamate carboxypeptidase
MAADDGSLPREISGRARQLLVELCVLSSPTGDADGVRAMAERLAAELGKRGLEPEIELERGEDGALHPVLLARGPAADGRCLLLVGHMDTVLPAIPPRLDGDRLTATGALDMKGGLAMLLGALDLMAARGQPLPAGFTLLAVPDEEASGVVSERVVRLWSERARAVLVLEPGEGRGDAETLVAGRRGLTEWRLEVTGRPSHSGLAYWTGRSAVAAASDWCLRAQRLSLPGPGRTVNVSRVVGGTADFVDRLAESHDLLGSSRQRNVIADRAVAEGEVRYLAAAEGTAVLAELAALAGKVAAEHEVEATLTIGASLPPVDPHGPGEALVRRAVELAAARGFRLEVETDRGGISFPNYLADSTSVPVVDGLGPVGDGMHTREEWLDLRSLDRRIVLLADLLATL